MFREPLLSLRCKDPAGRMSYAVIIFRRPEELAAVVDEAIRLGAGAVWMQDGLADNAAADRARSAGLQVVMSRCMMRDHRALVGR